MRNKFIKIFLFTFLLFVMTALSSCGAECAHKDMSETVVSPSCGARGYTVFACNDCSFSFESDFVSPSPHVLVSSVIASTCEQGGYTLHECSSCDYSYISEPTAIKDHTIASKTIAPTCTSEGYTLRDCSVCSYVARTNYVQPIEHDIKKTTVAPSCEKEGYTTYECKACDFEYTADRISALVHVFNSEITPPSCLLEGYTKKTCSICSDEIITDRTPPTGHTYTDTVYRATATKDGYTLHECNNCEYEYKSDYEYSYSIFMGAYTQGTEVLAKGVDVSFYNGALSWTDIAKAGVDYAILRAGSSVSGEDVTFATNYKNAKAAGLEVGVYYYVEAKSVDEILKHADELKKIISGKQFEYPIYLDIEKDTLGTELGKDLLTEMCKAFIEDLQSDGYFAALYTNNNWLENFYNKEAVAVYDIWYARYISADKLASPEWDLEGYGANMGMWQYTQNGVLDGVTASIPFDINLCYRDYPTIIKRAHYNGY